MYFAMMYVFDLDVSGSMNLEDFKRLERWAGGKADICCGDRCVGQPGIWGDFLVADHLT